jgi:hypothetical protein
MYVRVCMCMYVLSSSHNLIPVSAGVNRQAGSGGEAQRTQLQPFPLRFKNIIWYLEALCSAV